MKEKTPITTPCCKVFQDIVTRGDINDIQTGATISYLIHGRPYIVDDGDGYKDDMTPEYEITYCPFCGKKL